MTVYKDSHRQEVAKAHGFCGRGAPFDMRSQLHLLKRNRGNQPEQRRRLLHMKGKKIISTLLALLLLASLPVSALAAEWDIGNGDITVNAGSGGQTVTQGSQVDVPDSAPVFTGTSKENNVTIKPENDYNYIARINCGGDDYTDSYGLTWMQDNTNWSTSWGSKFKKETSPYQMSQTYNKYLFASPLFRTSRFGRHLLSYSIPAEPGDYRIELYFVEPWYGKGESMNTDYEGYRLFDVAVNDSTYIHDLDLWAQARYGKPYKRVIDIHNSGKEIKIDFPKVNAGQAIISAIAIATKNQNVKPVAIKTSKESKTMWADFEKQTYTATPDSLLPSKSNSAITAEGIFHKGTMNFEYNVGVAKVYALRFRYYNPEKERTLHVKITDLNGVVYKEDDITFVKTPEKKTKRRNTSITTGSQTNAGSYKVKLSGEGIDKMIFDKLTIE